MSIIIMKGKLVLFQAQQVCVSIVPLLNIAVCILHKCNIVILCSLLLYCLIVIASLLLLLPSSQTLHGIRPFWHV